MKRNPEVAILSLLSDVTGYQSYTVREIAMHTRLHESTVRLWLNRYLLAEVVCRQRRSSGGDFWRLTNKGRQLATKKYARTD